MLHQFYHILFSHICSVTPLTCFSCFHVISYANCHLTQRVDLSDISVTFVALSHLPEGRVKPSWAHIFPLADFSSRAAQRLQLAYWKLRCLVRSVKTSVIIGFALRPPQIELTSLSRPPTMHRMVFAGKFRGEIGAFSSGSIVGEKVWGRSRMFWFEDFDKN